MYRLGSRRPRATWWCEGYATGLSILSALNELGFAEDQVIVAFSAGGLSRLAKRGIVIADRDYGHCKNRHTWIEYTRVCPECGVKGAYPAGEKAARDTGLLYWLPPEAGMDANDTHLGYGINTLKLAFLAIRKEYLAAVRKTG